MRRIITLIFLFISFTPARLAAQLTCVAPPPVSMVWRMGTNGAEKNFFSNSFVIFNRGQQTLGDRWAIYFNQLPRIVKLPKDAPVVITKVNAGYYEMKPSRNYRPLLRGDSMVVQMLTSNGLIKESLAPTGAFIIINHNGKEQAPQTVAIEVMPFNNPSQWNRPNVSEPPYPTGEINYRRNALFNHGVCDATTILPTIKSYIKTNSKATIGERITISSPANLAKERKLLSEKLASEYTIITTDQGGFPVLLQPLPADFPVKNSEHYRLVIDPKSIRIEGNSSHAIFNGIQTLLSLLKVSRPAKSLVCGTIDDYPDLLYRGQMIDVARNFTPKMQLMQMIDLFSTYKINSVHLHLTDDEGWRLQIPGIEELTTVGAHRGYTKDEQQCLYPAYGSGYNPKDSYSAGNGFYTKEDFIEILKYANDRHIQIIPEIDLPGHARAAIVAMKARYKRYIKSNPVKAKEYLLSDGNDTSKYTSAQGYTDNVVNIAMPSTYRFIDKVTKEIAAMYRLADVPLSTIHCGGDEVPKGAWIGSPIFKVFNAKARLESDQMSSYFFQQTDSILRNYNVALSGWQELGWSHSGKVSNSLHRKTKYLYCWNTLAEWGGDVIPYSLANAGYDVILSNLGNFYFDLAYSKHPCERGLYWGGFVNEINSFDMQPFHIYRSCRQNLKGAPTDLSTAGEGKPQLTETTMSRIRGVQGQIWSENITNIAEMEYALFPKMFGLIERGWNASPAWAMSNDTVAEKAAYTKAVSDYLNQIAINELPYLAKRGINFRVEPPGILVKEGMLYMNSTIPDGEIRYTLDGSEPTLSSPIWKEAIAYKGGQVKARVCYSGKMSVVTRLKEASPNP